MLLRYGVPQPEASLAARLGKIELIKETHSKDNLVTVRETISHLPNIKDGAVDPNDFMHKASKLSPLNKEENQGYTKKWR